MAPDRTNASVAAPEDRSWPAVGPMWANHNELTLLIADPDEAQPTLLGEAALRAGVRVISCVDGGQALLDVGRSDPDFIVLAARLPVLDATSVVAAVRRDRTTPILIGVDPGDAEAAGSALIGGATTLVSRPYEEREVFAWVEKHRASAEARHQRVTTLHYGPLELDPTAFSVRLHGRELDSLPLKEFELLHFLMLNADRLVSSKRILDAVWGVGPLAPTTNTVAVHVSRLRSRLGGPTVLRTIRGLGYRLTFEAQPALDAPSSG